MSATSDAKLSGLEILARFVSSGILVVVAGYWLIQLSGMVELLQLAYNYSFLAIALRGFALIAGIGILVAVVVVVHRKTQQAGGL